VEQNLIQAHTPIIYLLVMERLLLMVVELLKLLPLAAAVRVERLTQMEKAFTALEAVVVAVGISSPLELL
jgi:hypothetical protein